ncbi:MAG: hypothetical protein Q9221_005772 [Calogaya cf. arnoldii]
MAVEILPAAAPYWLDQQDHTGAARGFAPFLGLDFTYPVYRNAKKYGAVGDGKKNDITALQNAINDDPNSQSENRYQNEVTTRPALVFVPGGTYLIKSTLDMRLNTILVGNPNDRPIIKASPDFQGEVLIQGHDYATPNGAAGTTNFLTAIKNIVIDTTHINKDKKITGLGWGVAQACHLTNIKIMMPNFSSGHTGIDIFQGSTVAVADIAIEGGAIGISNANQQILFKDISFKRCITALRQAGGWTAVVQGATIEDCSIGVDITGGSVASLIIIDSTLINSGCMVKFRDSSKDNGDRNHQIILENLDITGTNPVAIGNDDSVKLSNRKHVDTWIWGNVNPGVYQTGKTMTTKRSPGLLSNGRFFTMRQPTYQKYTNDQVVNVKAVRGQEVKGDGKSDDAPALNAILAKNAADGKLSYFPYGVYIVKSTLYVPPGTRIVGEAWSIISGIGSAFGDKNKPTPVVMVGKPGETGVAQIQDMRFTVADITPGAIILQVNMAGSRPGDVGFWNTHVTVGGMADSNVNVACSSPNTAACLAAFAMVHLTSSSSAYIENMWGWTADHSLERGGFQNIATGRGLLVEATKGTWLTGTSFEHNTLYEYNLHNAENVYAGLQQSENAYWQGEGSQQNAPNPWTAKPKYGDPDYSWCPKGAQACRMGLAQNINGGSNLYLYGAAFWTFFHGETQARYGSPETWCVDKICITNQNRVTGNPKNMYWYGINTKSVEIMVLDGKDNPSRYNHPGGWNPGGVIAAYLPFQGA